MRKKIVRNRSIVKPAGLSASGGEYVAALHRAVHAFGLYLDAVLEGEVSQAEAVVLLHLFPDGTATINEIHKAFLHKRSTLTSVVDRLEEKGLVRRSIGEADRRNFQLELTERGVKTAQRVAQSVGDLEKAMRVGAGDLDSCTRVLEKTAQASLARDYAARVSSRSKLR